MYESFVHNIKKRRPIYKIIYKIIKTYFLYFLDIVKIFHAWLKLCLFLLHYIYKKKKRNDPQTHAYISAFKKLKIKSLHVCCNIIKCLRVIWKFYFLKLDLQWVLRFISRLLPEEHEPRGNEGSQVSPSPRTCQQARPRRSATSHRR